MTHFLTAVGALGPPAAANVPIAYAGNKVIIEQYGYTNSTNILYL